MNKDEISKRVYKAHGGLAYMDARKVVDLILERKNPGWPREKGWFSADSGVLRLNVVKLKRESIPRRASRLLSREGIP